MPSRSRSRPKTSSKVSTPATVSVGAAIGNGNGDGAGAKQREFGDLMSAEGEVSHIPSILVAMYSMIFSYAYSVHLLTGAGVLEMCAYYGAGMLCFYLWHVMAHSKYFTTMHEIHMWHHLKRFPPSDFYGKNSGANKDTLAKGDAWSTTQTLGVFSPVSASAGTTGTLAHEGPLVALGLGIMCTGYFLGSSVSTLVMVLIGFLVMGFIANGLHISFHIRGYVCVPVLSLPLPRPLSLSRTTLNSHHLHRFHIHIHTYTTTTGSNWRNTPGTWNCEPCTTSTTWET